MQKGCCVITSYTPEFRGIGEYAAMTLCLYAARQGFSVFIDDSVTTERPPAWNKIQLILKKLAEGYEYVFWVDADATIIRFDVNIMDEVTEGKDLYIVEHQVPSLSTTTGIPNTGVMLFKNTEWSVQLLQKIWNEERFLHNPWWENAALLKLMGYNSILREGDDTPDESILSRVKFLPAQWNALSNQSVADAIVRHYAGQSRTTREEGMPRDALTACYKSLSELAAAG